MIHYIIKRLKTQATITNITTDERIYPLIRLQGSEVPALVVQLVGGTPSEAKDETSQVDDNLVEITALATDPATAWVLSQAVRDALDGYSSGYLAEVRFQTHASDIFESSDLFTITTRYLARTSRDASSLPAATTGLGYAVEFRGSVSYDVTAHTATAGDELILKSKGTEHIVFIDYEVGADAGTFNVYLPKVAEVEGRAIRIMTGKALDNNHDLQINPDKTDTAVTIDGAASFNMDRAYDGVMVLEHAGLWYVIQRKSK